MQILNKINSFYGKYLYMLVPFITLIIALMEVLFELKNGDMMHILANVIMGGISLSFLGFYLMANKRRIGYCLIELYLFCYTIFLAIDNHMHFRDIVWLVFLPCAILGAFLIILFTRKEQVK